MAWFEDNWGSLASVVGVLVSLFGFGIAIVQIRRSRSAATAAKEAAEEAREALARDLTVADLVRADEQIQSLKEFHRVQEWRRALDRYPDVRRLLAEIAGRHQNLTDRHRESIQDAISQVLIMELTSETALINNESPDMTGFNERLSGVQSMLDEAAIQLQQSTQWRPPDG